jgi:hypothetical protein
MWLGLLDPEIIFAGRGMGNCHVSRFRGPSFPHRILRAVAEHPSISSASSHLLIDNILANAHSLTSEFFAARLPNEALNSQEAALRR